MTFQATLGYSLLYRSSRDVSSVTRLFTCFKPHSVIHSFIGRLVTFQVTLGYSLALYVVWWRFKPHSAIHLLCRLSGDVSSVTRLFTCFVGPMVTFQATISCSLALWSYGDVLSQTRTNFITDWMIQTAGKVFRRKSSILSVYLFIYHDFFICSFLSFLSLPFSLPFYVLSSYINNEKRICVYIFGCVCFDR